MPAVHPPPGVRERVPRVCRVLSSSFNSQACYKLPQSQTAIADSSLASSLLSRLTSSVDTVADTVCRTVLTAHHYRPPPLYWQAGAMMSVPCWGALFSPVYQKAEWAPIAMPIPPMAPKCDARSLSKGLALFRSLFSSAFSSQNLSGKW